MEIREVIRKKNEAEAKIAIHVSDILYKLHQETGVSIESISIDLRTLNTVDGETRTLIASVSLVIVS